VALVIVAVTLPRLHGLIKIGTTGIEVFIREPQDQTYDLDVTGKAEVFEEIVRSSAKIESAVSSSPEAARDLAATLAAHARREREVKPAFVQWLSTQGWTVQTDVTRGGMPARWGRRERL
jgi:hypothetical protein